MAVTESVVVSAADDDASLVLAVQSGDTEVYAELFRRHYPAVRRSCARRLRDVTDADEVAQDAFVRALERIDRCGGERRFGAWVQVIAQRLCIDAIRAQSRTTPQEQPVQGSVEIGPNGPEERLLELHRAAAVRTALATLPARQRDVVIARDVDERRPPEIAAALGLSIGAVDSLLLRARRRLAGAYRAAAGEQGVSTAASSTAVAGTTIAAGNSRFVDAVADGLRAVRDAVRHLQGLLPATSAPSGTGRVAAAVVAGALALGGGGGGGTACDGARSPLPETPTVPAVPAVPAVPVPVPTAPAPPVAPEPPPLDNELPPVPVPVAPHVPAPNAPAIAAVAPAAEAVQAVVTGLTTAVGEAGAGVGDTLGLPLPVG